MDKDILQEAYLAGNITVNRYIMREFGVNPALLYAAFLLGQYASVKGGKDLTLRTVFEQLASDAHLSLHDLINAAETLDRAGFKVTVHVTDKTKGGNADE